jgi:hypothetical protein
MQLNLSSIGNLVEPKKINRNFKLRFETSASNVFRQNLIEPRLGIRDAQTINHLYVNLGFYLPKSFLYKAGNL